MKSLAYKINKKIYYGWVIVAIAALSVFFSSPGQTYSISVFNTIYENELGYSKTMLSTGYSIATTISGLLIIIIGRSVDKLGHRRMYFFVVIMLSVATFFSSIVTNIWMIYISFFLLRFFGQGSLNILPSSLVPQWFEKKRGFAISLLGLGNFLGSLFVPILNIWLITHFSWQNAWRIWGISLLVILLPLAFAFIYNRPEDLNIVMENEINNNNTKENARLLLEKESWTLKNALKTRAFWMIGIISMVPSMFGTGMTFHFYSIMGERSVTNETAAWIMGFMAFPILIMPLISSILIDRIKPKYIIIITQIMIVISMTVLWLFVRGAYTALLFIVFYGLATAIQSVTLNILWPNYYGRKYLGSIRGMTTVFMVLGTALGPLPFGVAYDTFGSFNPAIIAMIIFTLMTTIMALTIVKPVKIEDQ